jgi:hypothetical protein
VGKENAVRTKVERVENAFGSGSLRPDNNGHAVRPRRQDAMVQLRAIKGGMLRVQDQAIQRALAKHFDDRRVRRLDETSHDKVAGSQRSFKVMLPAFQSASLAISRHG